MKNIMSRTVTKTIEFLLFPILYFYERWIMYRIKSAWGKVHVFNIKNKGDNIKIEGYSRFLNPENLILGNNIRIDYDCFFYCKGGIKIDDNTIISRNVTIYSSNHNYNGECIPYDNTYIHKPVRIGKGVWIGMGVTIVPGVSIGDGAIIGMGTVVAKNVKPGEIVVGAESRVVGKRDMNNFYKKIENNKIFSLLEK